MCPSDYLMISELGRSTARVRGGRTRCDDCPAIDIHNPYHRELIDQPGRSISWRWGRSGKSICKVELSFHSDHVMFTDVTDQSRPNTEWVSLARTACHYGGTRPWFICPGCTQRCGKLYYHQNSFRCRKCHGLGYRSQLVASGERPRLIAHRIRRSLGASSSLTTPFPPKPPRMHWKTYYRIRAKGERYEARTFAGLAAWLDGRRRR
jgi:hypothetical protein